MAGRELIASSIWCRLISRNIGRFATIRSDLKAGRHTVTCELLEETKDPGGGHEFRLISMMR
jgi:hypothetical protein